MKALMHLDRRRILGALVFAVFNFVWLFDIFDPRDGSGAASALFGFAVSVVLGYQVWPALAMAFTRVPNPSPAAAARRIAGGFALSMAWVIAIMLVDTVVFGGVTPLPTLARTALVGTVFGYLAWPGVEQKVRRWRLARLGR